MKTGCIKKVNDMKRLLEKANVAVQSVLNEADQIKAKNVQAGLPMALDFDPLYHESILRQPNGKSEA